MEPSTVAHDPAFWQLVFWMSLLCVLSGTVGLVWPDREPFLMDWALVLGGLGVALFAATRLGWIPAGATTIARVGAIALGMASLLCLVRSRFWERGGGR
jgi:hypothetical protein